MIGEINNSGAAPALEAMIRFAGQRQRLLAHNLANITTPNFQIPDVSVAGFQRTLREAIERRHEGPVDGAPLDLSGNSQIKQAGGSTSGEFTLVPDTMPGTGNILFHDHNNRDLERMAQDNVENAAVFRIAADLLKGHHDLLRAAISERP